MYLNNHSYYSLRYGTLSVEGLIKEAKRNNVSSLALTDINNTMGSLDFVRQCNKNDIHPIVGIDFFNKNEYLYTGIAKNNRGFRELNEFLSEHNFSKTALPDRAPHFSDSYIVYPFNSKYYNDLNENEFIAVPPNKAGELFTSLLRNIQDKLLVWKTITFKDSSGYELHRNLRAIDNNILLSQLKPEYLADEDEIMRPLNELLEFYNDYPDIIKNTANIIHSCSFDFDFHSYKNKKTFTGSIDDDLILLEKLALDGLSYRYKKDNAEAKKRLIHELGIIHNLGFSAYFLITWDIIRYSMSRGFYHVGRGSGANSIVAYCLKITDVDPIELDLYFERFLNPKRTSPPDFDIDYSWKERDEVIDYIFKRYGRKHTALLGMTPTFKSKSVVRELGKVYGLPKDEIDRMVNYPADPMNDNEIGRNILEVGKQMTGFPNMRSIHAGGILISEEPISSYTALDMPPKGFPTTQWDMYVAESIGFEKFDILSQRGIGHIKDAVEIIKENKGILIDIHQVEKFKNDPKVKEQLRFAETNGCFYIESPAMRGLLKKLRCDNYISLVAASSIIRPGVARSGMMREYIRRFHNPGNFKYIHPVMEDQLKETYGVMVYQEDVLKVCHHFAGLDLADSDVLRRAMSGKHRSKKEFERIVAKFFNNCRQYGYPEDIIKEVWRQIESFAGYSFSKAHSASYAVESFQSLYLKTYFPREFMVAVINNFGGFYRTWIYFNEAKRWGAIINLPCVNNSEYYTIIAGKDIYIGFVHLLHFESAFAYRVVNERNAGGMFLSIDNFVKRLNPGLEQMILLIRIGAMRFTGYSKAYLFWRAHLLINKNKSKCVVASLFPVHVKEYNLPELEYNIIEDAFDEIEILKFPVTLSYFDLLQTNYRGKLRAGLLNDRIGETVRIIGQLVTIKYVRTIKKELMHFGTFIDVDGEFFDTVHFPSSLLKYPFAGHGVYLILGVVTQEFGYASVTVDKLAKLPIKKDPRYD